jgi:hypothetical protein
VRSTADTNLKEVKEIEDQRMKFAARISSRDST